MDRPIANQPIEYALPDADLAYMADRAWRRAARSWSEARQYGRQVGRDSIVARMLMAEAESAEDAWRRLANEQKRRAPKYQPPRPPSE